MTASQERATTMMQDGPLQDVLGTASPEQRAVIDAGIDEDVLVVAGAGSGKTFTMTGRIISLIVRGGVPRSRILGLTFTRAAAAELLSRVSAVVDAASGDGVGGEAGRERGAGLRVESMVMKPRVSTYDAFFQSIVAQYGALIGMDPRTQPLSEAGSIQMVSDIVSRNIDYLFANGLVGQDPGDGDPSGGSDVGSLHGVISQIRALSSAIADSVIDAECPTVEEAVGRIGSWDQAFLKVLQRLRREAFPDAAGVVPTDAVPVPPRYDETKSAGASFEEWLEADGMVGRLRTPRITPFRRAVLEHLIVVTRRRELLLPLVLDYAHEKRRRGMAEFSDFTVAALRLVRRFPSIGAEYRSRYTHVFLDEYQDTSTTQATLLAELFHRDDAHRSPVTAVGDPYQSIYSWRGASPGAFRQFVDRFHPKGRYGLTESRRNPAVVLDAANRLTDAFHKPYLPDTSVPLGSREVPVAPLRPVPPSPRSESRRPEGDASDPAGALPPFCGVMGFETRQEEALAVALFARAAVGRIRSVALAAGRASTVDDSGDDPGSSASAPDSRHPPVAVLFRSRGQMDVFADVLAEHGLRSQVIGNTPLAGRPDIADLLALLKAESDHSDPHPLLGLLASPRFGMDAHDLRVLAGLADAANVDYQFRCLVESGRTLESEGRTPAARRRVVAGLRQDTPLPAGVFLADVLLSADLETRMRSVGLSEGGRAIARRMTRMLRDVEDAGRVSVPDAVRAAADALDMEADDAVADALRSDGSEGYGPTWRDALDILLGQVDAYARELRAGRPTVLGFLQWFDALERQPDGPATGIDDSMDVVLMTVHQAKGLEWPAVAVVGMSEGTFPSEQGDRLSIVRPNDEEWNAPDGPAYLSTSRCWLDDPAAVPAPVRADRSILPRFPHHGDLGDISDLDVLEHETVDGVYTANGRRRAGAAGYAGQREEYGRRRHADERRLAYVALTRASREVLITYSARRDSFWKDEPGMLRPNPLAPDVGGSRGVRRASVFWRELFEGFRTGTVGVRTLEGAVARALPRFGSRLPSDAVTPIGFVRLPSPDGPETAKGRRYVDDLIESVADAELSFIADSSELTRTGGSEGSWPGDVEQRTREILDMTAKVVCDAMADGAVADGSKPNGSSTDQTPAAAATMPLSVRAKELVRARGSSEAVTDVIARANEVRARMNLGTTALEGTLAARNSGSGLRRIALSILRPMPSRPSSIAGRGTRFHEWAARFLDAVLDGDVDDRDAMLAGLSADPGLDDGERMWRRRLAGSVWARRRPVALEASITTVVDGLPVNGRLDAVFAGGFDPRRPEDASSDVDGRYVIVDWKTGRRPGDDVMRRSRLVQLDVYRLLVARQLGVPLRSVSATLCYIDYESVEERYVPAEPRDEEEILREIRDGRYLSDASGSEEE